MTTISERLRFHGRYGTESEQLRSARKYDERVEAADTIDALVAALEETLSVAERNERGDFGAIARSALSRARGDNPADS